MLVGHRLFATAVWSGAQRASRSRRSSAQLTHVTLAAFGAPSGIGTHPAGAPFRQRRIAVRWRGLKFPERGVTGVENHRHRGINDDLKIGFAIPCVFDVAQARTGCATEITIDTGPTPTMQGASEAFACQDASTSEALRRRMASQCGGGTPKQLPSYPSHFAGVHPRCSTSSTYCSG